MLKGAGYESIGHICEIFIKEGTLGTKFTQLVRLVMEMIMLM